MKIKNGHGLCNWPGSFKKRLKKAKNIINKGEKKQIQYVNKKSCGLATL